VIKQQDFSRWLDCRTQEPRDVAYLMRPPEEGFFEAIPVSDKVNKVANAGPDLQERVEPTQSTEVSARQAPGQAGQLTLF